MRIFLGELVVLPYDQHVATPLGRDPGLRPTARPPPAGERLVDRRLLPGPRPAARHVQHRGLRRLRGARRPPSRPLRTLDAERLVERTTANRSRAVDQGDTADSTVTLPPNGLFGQISGGQMMIVSLHRRQ